MGQRKIGQDDVKIGMQILQILPFRVNPPLRHRKPAAAQVLRRQDGIVPTILQHEHVYLLTVFHKIPEPFGLWCEQGLLSKICESV